ncbi:hypothetical protein GPECTOR_36g33 [Gonium pectorale]|uniref:RING-type domain-containing protein n=1 Tax=Gonium pectorale TaxID=33097 RepID=A0A150GBU9_GONPE|nr:hypothetical protein GPECTOR_36g33 [Gonium pectorale]|eukprot:KXZ47308.1 hypothetical protein GPECTOR_36g33 [Gonium pectorale]
MCVVCWNEFDSVNPPVDLGCGHYGCEGCRDGLASSAQSCPVCNQVVTLNGRPLKKVKSLKPWVSPRRRGRAGEDNYGDVLDDDVLAPTTLGSADAATPPRLLMLERAPSSAESSGGSAAPGRAQQCVALSARHIAHGGIVVTRVMLMGALLPAARTSFHVSRTLLTTTCRVAACTGRALAVATCRMVRFATAPRYLIAGVDGSLQQLPLPLKAPAPQVADCQSTDDEGAVETGAVVSGRSRSGRGRGGGRRRKGDSGVAPEPLINLKGARITLRDCKHTRIRIEYCQDCVVVASHLQSVELLLVCCQRVKLVLRNCEGLLLRELQCSNMGDCVRRRCPNFVHEIVCLRCACKPRSSSAGSAAVVGY